MSATRIPLNFFAMPFGLSGLATSWLTMANYGLVPHVIGYALVGVAVLTWIAVAVAYGRWILSGSDHLRADLTDAIGAPFFALAVITPALLGAESYPLAPIAARVVVDVFLVLTFLLGAWYTGQWIYRPLDLDKIHPGYLLPTVAAGLITGAAAAQVGQRGLGEFLWGAAVVGWTIMGPLVMYRLMFRGALPTPLLPTLAIEVAPAGAASLGYFALHGDRIDLVITIIGGYGLVMALAQLRLLGAYRTLHFMPSTWAFTFSWAVVVTTTIHWLNDESVAGHAIYEYVLLAAITVLVGAIGIRTLIALARHQLLPKPAPVARALAHA
jgi:tellurite resistance protein